MNQPPHDARFIAGDAEPVPPEVRARMPGDGLQLASLPPDERPVPPLSLRELLEERNWTALAGLALVGIGVLVLLQDALEAHLSLWALLLVGLGGWLAADGWNSYQRAGAWDSRSRNRVWFGTLMALVGVIGLLDLNWWGLLLLVIGARYGQQTWRRYQRGGRVWTTGLRRRAFLAIVVSAIGLFSFLHLGSAGPLLLVILGAGLFLERVGR